MLLVSTAVLGKHGFGDYTAVMSFVALFAVATDPGLTTLAVRDVAQDLPRLPRYVGNILSLRIGLSVLTIAACVALSTVFAQSLGFNGTVRLGIIIWSLALLPNAITTTTSIVFQATERMATLSLLMTLTALLTAALGSLSLLLGGRLIVYLLVIALVNTGISVAAVILARRRTMVRPLLDVDWWPSLLRIALPFATLTLLNVLYSRADTLLVIAIKGSGDAGLYGVAYRLVDTLLALAISPINAAILPAFNRIAAGSRAELHRLVVSGIRIMLAISVPVAVAASAYPHVLLLVFKPEYREAAAALQWLAWSFPCFMVLAILYNALYAINRADEVARTFGVALVFNVALNLLLIPRYSYVASAALTTASEALNVALVGWAVYRHVGPLGARAALLKVAMAGLAMYAVTWASRGLPPLFSLAIGLPLGLAVYLATLRLTATLGDAERDILAPLPLVGRYAGWLVASGE
jgi:O-antigen/teichoic acid export membrane protein